MVKRVLRPLHKFCSINTIVQQLLKKLKFKKHSFAMSGPTKMSILIAI